MVDQEGGNFGVEDGPGLRDLARDLTRGKEHLLSGRLEVPPPVVVPRMRSMPSTLNHHQPAPLESLYFSACPELSSKN